ncbi:uncharacterized protein [Rutidosis leptorrhynchoides]|uniref:uncharacterized protein n=1 Tax=Rutidosis leptorrhynchoides TaxID=125765 RepID=UPI003A98D93A
MVKRNKIHNPKSTTTTNISMILHLKEIKDTPTVHSFTGIQQSPFYSKLNIRYSRSTYLSIRLFWELQMKYKWRLVFSFVSGEKISPIVVGVVFLSHPDLTLPKSYALVCPMTNMVKSLFFTVESFLSDT